MPKRLLAFLLVLCLAVGAMPTIPTLAATPPQYKPTAAEAVDEANYIFDELCADECDCYFFIILVFVPFDGQYCDTDTTKGYLRARSYNPRTGRFSSPDPFFHVLNGNINDSPLNILQAGNLYMFVMHNPVRWVDPSGLSAAPSGSSERLYIMCVDGVSRPLDLSRPLYITDGNTTVRVDKTQPLYVSDGYTTRRFSNLVGGPHEPYTPFLTKEIAMLAWGNTFNTQTTQYVRWYSWLLMHRNTGMFTFGTAVNSGADMTAQRHRDHTRVGAIHTHRSLPRRYTFTASYIDSQTGRRVGDGHFVRTSNLPLFLVAPSGTVRRLDPSWPCGEYLDAWGRIRNDAYPHVREMPFTTRRRIGEF